MRFRSFLIVVVLAQFARASAAQVPDSTHRTVGATLSGIVFDSLARKPLAGAWVQLVAADGANRPARTVTSDALGRFTIADVPDGRYMLGFFHPMIDSLGIEPPVRDVAVTRQRAVHANLAIPSGLTIAAAVCGVRAGKDSGVVVQGGAVIGVVRDVQGGAPVSGAKVTGEWLEYSFQPGSIGRRRPRLVVATGATGWFALCNVPAGGSMLIGATRGADSTDLVELQVPRSGFARRELYIGAARRVVAVSATPLADTLAPTTRRIRVGDVRLTGTVLAAESRRPLAGAFVSIVDGPQVRASDQGEWTIANAPAGTRTIEVRSVGFYPERRPIDVIPGAPPLTVALNNFRAVLDTVKVVAIMGPDRHFSGFAERQRSGIGHYYTAADFEKRGVIETSDLFKNVPGVYLRHGEMGTDIMIRSDFVETDRTTGSPKLYCKPSVYLDGMPLFEASADEIDVAAPAKRVRAIEVYTGATSPPQFQAGLTGCGAIVIWTK
jgi:Carboxypeptidase regulatory-like domain